MLNDHELFSILSMKLYFDSILAVVTVPTGNGAITNSSRLATSMDGDIGNNKRSDQRILSPPSLNRISLSGSSSHVVASTTITNLDAQSQKFKLVSIPRIF